MKNDAYWENRQAQRMFEYMESAERIADEIAGLYQKASIYLDACIDDIFERYRDKYGLSDEEAKKLLESLPDDATIKELKKALEKNPNSKELLEKLESPAYEFRIRRLQELRDRVDDVMSNIYNQEIKASISHYTELASESYYKSMFDIQQMTGFGFVPPAVTTNMIDRVINSKWSGQNYSKRIWKNTDELAKTVKQELLLGLLTGKTNREVADDIRLRLGSGASNARRLVRTESNYLCGQMQKETYKKFGIEKYRYLATLDLRTSKMCQALDGKIYLVSAAVVGKNYPPLHPWCRSTVISIVDEKNLSRIKRSALDPATGKTIKVPANMTYAEWYEKYVKSNPKAQLEEKKIKNRFADKKQYERYKKVLGNQVPKSLDEFQEMKYNDTEKWEYTKGLKKYLEKYPTSNKRYYDIQEDIKKLGLKAGVPLPPVQKQAFVLPVGKRDSYHIMNRMIERGITDDMVRGYMKDAKCMFSQWGGQRQAFYSDNGVSVITKSGDDWIYKTTWSKNDFDSNTETILEVINKHVK